MKTLILVRHAESSRDDPMLDDADRSLNRRGYRDAQKAAKQFARSGYTPDLLAASPSRRTRETAGFFAERLALPPEAVQFDPRIYEAELAELVRLIHGFNDRYSTVMLVGHNPGITDLFHHLLDSTIHHLPAGSIAVVELPATGWRDIACNTGLLAQFIFPKGEKLQLTNADDDAVLPLTIWQKIFFWRMQFDRKLELFGFFLVCLALVVAVVLLMMSRMTSGGDAAIRPSYHVIEPDNE